MKRLASSTLVSSLLTSLLSILRAFLSLLPISLSLRLGSFAGRIIYLFFNRERRISLSQLQAVSRLNSKSAESISRHRDVCRGVFEHVGKAAVETFLIKKLLSPKRASPVVKEKDGQHFWKVIESGSGVIVLSGHLGSFELLAAYYASKGVALSVIGRKPNYPALYRWIDDVRRDYGVETLWRTNNSSASHLLRALKNGKVIAALIDQDTSLDNTFAPFLGLTAASPLAPIKLAMRYGVPLWSVLIVRQKNNTHLIHTKEIRDGRYLETDTPEQILHEFNQTLEELIYCYPEQWLWWHRRWRRRPNVDYKSEPDKLRSTTEYLAWLNTQ